MREIKELIKKNCLQRSIPYDNQCDVRCTWHNHCGSSFKGRVEGSSGADGKSHWKTSHFRCHLNFCIAGRRRASRAFRAAPGERINWLINETTNQHRHQIHNFTSPLGKTAFGELFPKSNSSWRQKKIFCCKYLRNTLQSCVEDNRMETFDCTRRKLANERN